MRQHPIAPRSARRWRNSAGASLAIALLAAQAAAAQTTDDTTTPAAGHETVEQAAARSGGLEEIVVTATKRNDTVFSAPVSVTAISGQELANLGTTSITQLDARIPNFKVSESITFPSITMRGIGSGTGTSSFDQTVSVFSDGIYAARSRQFLAPYFDVDHIEVLRGPQGAIVGKNTSAGAIVVVSAQPTRDLMASVDAAYNFTLHQSTVTGIVSGPIGGGFGFRVAGQYDQLDRGYLHNTLTGEQDPRWKSGIIRGIINYEGDEFTAFGKVEYSRRKLKGGFLQAAAPGQPGYELDYQRDTGGAGPEYDDLENVNVALNMAYDAGGLTLSSITGFSAYNSSVGLDPDGIALPLIYAVIAENFQQYSQEFRVATPVGNPLELVAGVYGQHYRQNAYREVLNNLNPAGGYYVNFDQKDDAISAFAELQWNISPAFRIRGGGRYTYEKKTAYYTQLLGANAFSHTGTPAPGAPFNDKLSEGLFDPSVVVQWEPSDSAMLFASFARGSKGGAFQGDVAAATLATYAVKPERASSFEGGAKLRFADNRGRIGITLFRTKYTALQLSEIDPNAVNTIIFRVRNAGEAVTRGVELEGAFQATDWLTFNVSAAYLDAKYTNYTAGDCAPGQVPNGSAPGSCNYNGVTLPQAPKWNGNVVASIDYPLAGDWSLISEGTLQFSSKFMTNSTNDPMSVQSGFAKVDLSLGVTNGRLRVAVLAKNLTDKLTQSWSTLTPVAATAGGLGQDVRLFKVDQPRTVALQLGYKF